jgi:Protein of unknown function (DUF1592)/Protein of unknown function (DUF1588)/Protein of unknown function (DUF1595)/Protein of unknown function (DUF1587)/Protein of unknown function (DUF1585)
MMGGAGTTGLAGGGPTVPGPAPGTSDVGTVGIHQLSSREYNNTVRDLVGTALKPGDGFQSFEAAGFDTLAAAGVMNSRKVSDYFSAAATLAQETMADPTRRAAIVTCQQPSAGDTTCAESIIKTFGARAFRRPLETTEVADLVVRYQAALAQQLDHNGAIQHVVRILLASPQFIYRAELDPDPTTVHPLSNYELASRMSYLLWSSMPDAALFASAANNELQAPEKLVSEVERLLADKRSSELAQNFAAQWLGSRRLSGHVVDAALFPAWTPALGVAMQQEMSAYFDDFLHGQQTYDKFLTSQVNFVDSNLAKFYGLPDPGPTLTRVPNPTGNRVGFLGLAGFLTHTSRPDRTAPSIRGKWVLGSIKCQELELPTNIMVPELVPPAAGQTVRQVLEAHRGKPACAPCHNVLDPIGLGLEHFDAIGSYRDTYTDGLPVDSKATFTDGTNVDGLAQLADALSKDPAVVACAAKKLFVYGLGRTADGSEGHLDQIVKGWQARGLSLENLLKELVVNDTFRARHGNGN